MAEDADRWLTTAETAARLRTTPSNMRKWRHRGYGPLAVMIGGRRVYLEADVTAWEKKQRQAAQDERDRWTPAAHPQAS